MTAKDFANGAMGMNFLVAGGTSAAYMYSVVLVILSVTRAQVLDALCFYPVGAPELLSEQLSKS